MATVDDTPIGIKAGLHAGTATIAVSQTGSTRGLSAAEVAALVEADLNARLDKIAESLRRAGADFVIRSVAQLPALLAGLTNNA